MSLKSTIDNWAEPMRGMSQTEKFLRSCLSDMAGLVDALAARVAVLEKRPCERCEGTGRINNKSAMPGRISAVDCPDCTGPTQPPDKPQGGDDESWHEDEGLYSPTIPQPVVQPPAHQTMPQFVGWMNDVSAAARRITQHYFHEDENTPLSADLEEDHANGIRDDCLLVANAIINQPPAARPESEGLELNIAEERQALESIERDLVKRASWLFHRANRFLDVISAYRSTPTRAVYDQATCEAIADTLRDPYAKRKILSLAGQPLPTNTETK